MTTRLDTSREEFVAQLARALPDVAPLVIATAAKRLMLAARTLERLAVYECNEGPLTPRMEKLEKKMHRQVADNRLGLDCKIGGDPRGYVLKIHLPNGVYNTMGGKEEGWGVPT